MIIESTSECQMFSLVEKKQGSYTITIYLIMFIFLKLKKLQWLKFILHFLGY